MRKQKPLPAPRCCRYDLHADVKPPTAPAENSRSNRLYCIRTCTLCRRLCLYHADCPTPFFVASFNPVLRSEVRLLGSLVQDLVRLRGDKAVARAFSELFPVVVEKADGAYRECRQKVADRLGTTTDSSMSVYRSPQALAAMGRRSTSARP